ncbi:Predicted dehydrogenase [Lachnospiraceae bacterium C10]|nr:Predicted dehydrogenase [Lachnospiraceae bacterium C10]
MTIAIIGLGSMGKRRIRLISEMYPQYKLLGIDAREDRRREVEAMFSIFCASSLDEIEVSVDCVFVCTSPLSHHVIISDALKRGCHVFTELNLIADGYDENIKLAKKNQLKLFLSSTFLYREEIRYIKENIDGDKRWNYIYHVGQYLPDWHPWENYKDFFLGDKRTNGCRELLAIELPWIVDTFGEVESTNNIHDQMTELKIDYADNFMIQLNHKSGSKGILVVDVVSPVAVRKLEIYSEKSYLSWNGTPETLMEYDCNEDCLKPISLQENVEHREGYRKFITENAYKNEIKAFFDYVLNDIKPSYTFEEDRKIIQLIDMIGA